MTLVRWTTDAPRVALAALLLLAASGCHGSINGRGDDGGGVLPDGALESTDGGVPGTCAIAPLLMVFEGRCTNAGCHASGGQFPELTPAGLQSGWVTQHSHEATDHPMVVPGDPSSSWIYRKVAGMQGAMGGALMPLGSAMPTDVVPVIEDWIRSGASTHCDGDAGVATVPTRPDPNNLDQATLFTCPAGAAAGGSPARLRRIDQPEWTYAVGKPLSGTFWGSTAYQNPFTAPATLPYSTYSIGVTLDPTIVDLYMLVLPEAPANWDSADPAHNTGNFVLGTRTYPVYGNAALRCIYTDAAPTAACIDHYVDQFLTLGVLSRTPTPDERARFRAFLVAEITAEGGDVTRRQQTLLDAGEAAWLTSRALFREEMGAPVPGDAAGRSRLTNDELALALGSVLSPHRPGSPMPVGTPRPGDPDWATPQNGWLQQVRAAADDGSIQNPTVMRRLITTYQGGIDAARHDLDIESDPRRIPGRGEYWLAPRIAGFFREWLGYGAAATVFKDTPEATSQWDGTYTGNPLYDPNAGGYSNLQNGYYEYESLLVQQMDDTIARAVLDAASSHTDVFRALMTTRLWHLPSNVANSNGQVCRTAADCTSAPYTNCTAIGVCEGSTSTGPATEDRPYNIAGQVPATSAGRWVTMPATERLGVLTHPAWLAAHGDNFEDDASLVHRGRWVRENLFCQTVPGLENVMVEARLVDHAPALSARDRVHQSIEMGPSSTTCMGCHGQMNTLGYPFETYNHAGFVRTMDHGRAPDGSTTVTNAPDATLNQAFASVLAYVQAIADSPYARRCFIRQAFRYFMGRDETVADACTLTAMETALNNGSFFDMVSALVSSDAFLYRTPDTGAMP